METFFIFDLLFLRFNPFYCFILGSGFSKKIQVLILFLRSKKTPVFDSATLTSASSVKVLKENERVKEE
jgi:hypothetical protein